MGCDAERRRVLPPGAGLVLADRAAGPAPPERSLTSPPGRLVLTRRVLRGPAARDTPRPHSCPIHGGMGMILRCYRCSHGRHDLCDGSPEAGTCRCSQCWTRHILKTSRQVIESSNIPQKLRQAAEDLYALQFQISVRRQRAAAREPTAILPCQECGRPVTVWRLDPRGTYCRDKARCKTAAYRRRRRQAAAA